MEYKKAHDYKNIRKQADEFYNDLLTLRKEEERLKKEIAKCQDRCDIDWRDDEAYKEQVECQKQLTILQSKFTAFYNHWHKTELYNEYGGIYCVILSDVERALAF